MHGILPKIAQRLLKNNWTRCIDWNFQTAHQFKAKIKKQQDKYENKKKNSDSRRTQKENDQEILIFEEPMLMIPNDGILMELFLDVVKMVRKLWIEMGKILLGVVVILKVHDEYGRKEVRPALG